MCRSATVVEMPVPLVEVVGQLLQSVSDCKEGAEVVGMYDGQKAPAISMADYLQRFLTHTQCDKAVMVLAVVYIDRVCTNTGIDLTKTNVHRLLLAGLVVALKWHQDRVLSNPILSAIGGVATAELARLERTFLNDLQWETHVSPALFAKYQKRFIHHLRTAQEQ